MFFGIPYILWILSFITGTFFSIIIFEDVNFIIYPVIILKNIFLKVIYDIFRNSVKNVIAI